MEGSLYPGERMLVIHGTDFLSSQGFASVSSLCVILHPWLEAEMKVFLPPFDTKHDVAPH